MHVAIVKPIEHFRHMNSWHLILEPWPERKSPKIVRNVWAQPQEADEVFLKWCFWL